MEILLDKTEIISRREIWNSSVRREEMADCVVPDTCPDILRIIDACADVLIRGKEAAAGKATAEGVIDSTVLYIAEEGSSCPQRLSLEIPFSVSADVPEATEETDIIASFSLESLEVRVLNPRKILVKVEVMASFRCFNNGTLTVITGIQPVQGLQIQKKSGSIAPIMDVREKTFVISDEIMMPPAPEGYECLLCHRIRLATEDVKFIGNKLIFKGEATLNIMAQPKGDVLPVCFGTVSSFSQIMELSSEAAGECSELTLCLTGAYFDIGQGEAGKPVVNAEMHILAQTVTSVMKDIEYVSDAYSTACSLDISYTKLTVPKCGELAVVRDTVRAVIETSEPAAAVLCASAMTGAVTIGDGYIKSPVRLRAIYTDASGNMYSAEKTEELKIETESTENIVSAYVTTGEVYAAPVAGGIDIRLPAQVQLSLSGRMEISMVGGVIFTECVEKAVKPSLIILPACGNAEVWNLAKKYCSTPELIMEFNSDGTDILLIPVKSK